MSKEQCEQREQDMKVYDIFGILQGLSLGEKGQQEIGWEVKRGHLIKDLTKFRLHSEGITDDF